MSNSHTSSTVKKWAVPENFSSLMNHFWAQLLIEEKMKTAHNSQTRDICLQICHVCHIVLLLYEWGLRTLITSLPLPSIVSTLSFFLSIYPNNHTLSLLVSVFYVAACASDLNSQQGVVGRDSRCEGSLWLRESWRSNTLMIRTTGWQWRGGL